MLCLFIVDGQGGQAVQLQPGGVPGNVLVIPLRRDHGAVVAAEFQLRQVHFGPQLLGTIIHQLAQPSVGSHTTGKAGMTKLDKILYLADYMEPTRDFDGVEDLRKVVWEDIDRGLAMGLAMTVEEMEERGNPVHHNTLEALDELRGHSHE